MNPLFPHIAVSLFASPEEPTLLVTRTTRALRAAGLKNAVDEFRAEMKMADPATWDILCLKTVDIFV